VETDNVLKGTKRIIVRQGNVYIGKGRKDDRSIVVIPATSEDPTDGSRIRYLLLLNIGFQENTPLGAKIKALGGKYEYCTGEQHPLGRCLARNGRHGRTVRPFGGKNR
jgi:glucosamine--fructose-6-phosphate aminotransferase (isomerizing)